MSKYNAKMLLEACLLGASTISIQILIRQISLLQIGKKFTQNFLIKFKKSLNISKI